jgi:predicted phosphodiesterase
MKIAVISDMHGNALALEAVLQDLRPEAVDQIVCLGDAIQGGPQPAEVIAHLRALGCPVVMGNADDWLLSGTANDTASIPEERLRRLDVVREWQLTQLTDADRAFMATFQPTVTLPLEQGRSLLCYHGSPRSFDDIILPLTPDETVRDYLQPQDAVIYTGGHTHVQFMRHFGNTFHFNPGSIGYAFRHDQAPSADGERLYDGWAEYAVLTVNGGQQAVTFRRVPFDVQHLITIYRRSGRPFAELAIRQYGG